MLTKNHAKKIQKNNQYQAYFYEKNKKNTFGIKITNLLVFTVLLFLASPAFSILRFLLGGIYFPNEKIGFLIVICYLYFREKNIFLNKNTFILYLCSVFLAISIFLRAIIYGETITTPDINIVYMLFALPLYIKFYKTREFEIVKILHYITFIQIGIACYQWYMVMQGNMQEALFFHNHPYQANYVFPKLLFLVRVSGLFNESSSFSIFLGLYYVFYEKYKDGKYKSSLLSNLSLIMIISNLSIAGYLILTIYWFIKFFPNYKKIKINKNYIKKIVAAIGGIGISLFFLYLKNKEIIQLFFLYVTSRAIGLADLSGNRSDGGSQDRRLEGLMKTLELVQHRFILGYGSSWDYLDRWDFLSNNLYAYGFLGVMILLIYIFLLTKNIKIAFYSVLIPALMANGSISMSIYALIFPLITLEKRKITKIKFYNSVSL